MAIYNPSNHIPLSKAMGATKFPVDGKFMYFTNGDNGKYEYRPFVSLAEVISYFPLGSVFRNGAFEICVNSGGTLSGDGSYITGGLNSIYWWANGLTDADLILKTGAGGESIGFGLYSGSDLDLNGNLDISSTIIGRNTSFVTRVDFDYNAITVPNPYDPPILEGYFNGFYGEINGTLYISSFPPAGGFWNIVVFVTSSIVPQPAGSPPVFTIQPPSTATVLQDSTFLVNVNATGALGYQWKFNGVNISGQTNATLNIPNFSSSDNGSYTCDAYNSEGTTTSTACVATNDVGIRIYNNTNLTPDGVSMTGVEITSADGINTNTIDIGSIGRFLTATATLILTQPNEDAKLFLDYYAGTKLFNPVYGLDAPNTYTKPTSWPLEVAVFSLQARTSEIYIYNNTASNIQRNDNGAGNVNILPRLWYSKMPVVTAQYMGVTIPLNTKLIVTIYDNTGAVEDITEYPNTASPTQTTNISLDSNKGFSALVTAI